MGLLSGVLLLPLTPVRGVVWLADRLVDAAERETRDPDVLRTRLRLLNQALEDGEIDQATFEREEERVLDLLEGRPATGPTPRPPTTPSTTPPEGIHE
jgi:gas vesicle protein GvpG